MNTIELKTLGLTCTLTSEPGDQRSGDITDVPGDGWCLLHSLALTRGVSAQDMFMELMDFMRAEIGLNPINVQDLSILLKAYVDKSIWFDDSLIIVFCNAFHISVKVYNSEGSARYMPPKGKGQVDLRYVSSGPKSEHYSIYSDCVGIIKLQRWSEIVENVEWQGCLSAPLIFKGESLSTTLAHIPAPFFDTIKETLTKEDYQCETLHQMAEHGFTLLFILKETFYVSIGLNHYRTYFVIYGGDDSYHTFKNELVWVTDLESEDPKEREKESYLRINPRTKSLNCSDDYLSILYGEFQQCFVGLINWIFENQLSQDVIELLLVLCPKDYDFVGPLCEVLGIKLYLHYGHNDTNTAYCCNSSEFPEYHISILSNGYRFLYRWNYTTKNDKRGSEFLMLTRRDIYKDSTFNEFVTRICGLKGRLYKKSIDTKLQKHSVTILKFLTQEIERNVFELSLLLRFINVYSSKQTILRSDVALDSPTNTDINLRNSIKKVGYSNPYYMIVIDSIPNANYCSRRETSTVKQKPTSQQKRMKRAIKTLTGIEEFPSVPNYSHNLIQYSPEPKKFFFPEPANYISAHTRPITVHHIDYSQRGIIVIDFEDDGSSISTHNNNHIVVKRIDAKNFIHDFTFNILAPDTDMSFASSGMGIKKPDDKLTPDLIVKADENKFYVYEFATRRSSTQLSLDRATYSKDCRYKGPIEERAQLLNLNVFYGIISVSPQALQTNIVHIPKELCEELIFRMRVANLIFNDFIEKDIEGCKDTEISTRLLKIQSTFRCITMDDMRFVQPFSKEMYNGFAKEVNSEDATKHTKLLLECFEMSKSSISEELKVDPDSGISSFEQIAETKFNEKLVDFYGKYREDYPIGTTRTDMKPPIQVPLIYCKNSMPQPVTEWKNELLPIFTCDYSNAHTRLISKCFYGIENEETINSQEFDFVLMDKEERVEAEKVAKRTRMHYRRVTYELSEEDCIDLAEIGPFGKKYKEYVQHIRDYKKQPFDLTETEVSDISELLNTDCLNLFEQDTEMTFKEDIDSLLKDSLSLHNTNSLDSYLKTYEFLKLCRIAHWARFISDLGSELSISVKQFCKTGTAILKKLKNYSVYILIIPTGGPIFFSLLFPKSDILYSNHSSVFKKLNETKEYYYTEFVSVNSSKLRNLVLLESVLYSSFMLFAELCKVPVFGEVNRNSDEFKTACGLTLLSLLICLDDKAKTEEICTLNRYIQMEGFVHFPKVMEQEKILSRLNLNVRSRLELYICKCLIDCMALYSSNPCRLIVHDNRRKYTGIKIPYLKDEHGSMRDCHSPELMLNIVYIGYIKNKDESAEVNALGQLVSKIIGWEDSVPSDPKYLGFDDPNPKTIEKHEFNVTAIRFLCAKARERIKKNFGVTKPYEYIDRLILDTLSKQSLEQFATLKASSNFDERYYYYVPMSKSEKMSKKAKMETTDDEEKIENYKRSKVIVKLKKLLDNKEEESEDSTLVVDLLLDALDQVEKNMCLHVCIFKKNQHAGLREIYVLNISERIIQKTIEDISRAILSCFPSETMTHPSNKYRLPEEHNKDSRNNLGAKYVTYNTSDDAKKWNQGHYVTKFICMLVQLTPKAYHGFICRTLQLWLDKRIMLPVELIGLFNSLDEIHTRDEYVSRLFNAYKGISEEKWIKKGQSYIRTTSGFMQGILHYTSSLYHTIILDFLSEASKAHLSAQIRKISPSLPNRVVVTNMQSSDDSAMMISVPVVDENSRANSQLAFCCYLWFKVKEIYSLQLGIYKSEKSTTMTQFIMEFNSEFQFLGEIQKPTIRWVYASCLISEQETLVSRQEEMANTLKDVVEGGGSFIIALYCQIAQLILHYRLLGSGVSMFWNIYTNLIKKIRDPALGYFLMDNNICPGILGFNYNLWNSYDNTVLAVRYKQQSEFESRAPIKETIKQITPDTLSLSMFTRLTTIRFGNKKIWERLMSNMNFTPEIWDKIEEDPSILYYGASNVDEVIKKMAIKMKAPGVVASLGSSNSLVRIISTGVYIMSRSVVSTQSAMFDKSGERVMNKAPLLQLLIDENEKTVSYLRSVDMVKPNPNVPSEIRITTNCLVKINQSPEEYLLSIRPDLKHEDIEQSKGLYVPFLRRILSPDDKAAWMHFLFTIFNVPHQLYRTEFGSEDKFLLSNLSDIISTKWDDKSVRRIFYRGGDLYYQVVTTTYPWDGNDLHLYTLGNEIRKMLFPFEMDYQSIRHNLSLIDDTPMGFDPGHRRRTRSNLVIAGSESNDLFSLEEIAKYIWFRKNKPPLSEGVIQDLWSNYKLKYPFLQDTVEETLAAKDCPFPNHISLRNFIARQDKGPRVIHLTGSHGRHGTQHANLLTVIKNNTSDNYNYEEPIVDDNKRTEHLNYETVMHTLAMLSEIPIESQTRNWLMEDLLSKSPIVTTNIYAQGGRRNKISLMQTLLQEDPEMILNVAITENDMKDYYCQSLQRKIDSYPDNMLSFCMDEVYHATDGEESILPEQDIGVPLDILRAYNFEPSYRIEDIRENYIEANWDSRLLSYLASKLDRNIIRLMARGEVLTYQDAVEKSISFIQKRNKLIQNISLLKLGVIGGYTVRQRRSPEGLYYGRGQWEGHFNNIGIKIEVDSENDKTVFTSIRVNKAPTDIKIFLGMLRTWCNDHRVSYSEKQLKPTVNGVILNYLYENKIVKSYSKHVTPLVLDANMEVVYNLEMSDFRLDLTDHNLRLMAKVQNSDVREITSMQLKFTGRDINPNIKDVAPHDFFIIMNNWSLILSSWVKFEMIDVELSNFFSRTDMVQSSLFPTEARLNWSTNIFRNAIYRMHLDRGNFIIKSDKDEPHDDGLQIAIKGMMELSSTIDAVLSDMPQFSLDDMDFDEIIELLASEDVHDKNLESSSKLFVHPLVDGIILSAIKRFSSNVIRNLIQSSNEESFKLDEQFSSIRPILESYHGRVIDLSKIKRNLNTLDKMPGLF